MKKFLLPFAVAIGIAATSCGTVAAADGTHTQWTTKNKAGGSIVLTDSPCVVGGTDYLELRSAFTFGDNDDTVAVGCWMRHPDEPTYIVGWFGPAGVEIREYPVIVFKRTSAAAAGAKRDRLI